MREISYLRWGLIPIDDAPRETPPTVFNPPMLTNMAFDGGASLVFELGEAAQRLHIEVQTTASSAIAHPGEGFQIFSGPALTALAPRSDLEWDMRYDGAWALYTALIEAPDLFVKLHNASGQSTVVTRAHFAVP